MPYANYYFMLKKVIRFCYRKTIDANASAVWEQRLFNDSYHEFLLQVQLYNREEKYTKFSELITHVPNADKLHFLVSTAAVNYLRQLNGIIPDVKNVLGKCFLPFSNYRFEIVESDIQNKTAHKVAINFISEPLTWYDTIDNHLLLSVNNTTDADGALLTDMLALQSSLSIFSLKTITS